MISLISILIFVTSANSSPTEVPKSEDGGSVKETWKDCKSAILNPMCLKLSVITVLEKLNSKDDLQLLPGVAIVKESETKTKSVGIATELLKSIPSADEKLDKYLVYRLGDYLDTHSVRLKLLDVGVVEEARSLYGEARKKDSLGIGGKKGGFGTLIAMAMMMKGTLMSVGIGGLALLAGKALMTAMMSLLLSAVIGLKSLTSGGKSTTYEIVAKPVYSHSHSHSTAHEDVGAYGHSGYGRNFNTKRR